MKRYFVSLGEAPNISVKWCDYDDKSKIITINDEKRQFDWKLPQKDLFKSFVHVVFNKKKKFVVTLFYTTFSALVQGQATGEWVHSEFMKIKEVVESALCTKGDKSCDIDTKIKNTKLDPALFNLPNITIAEGNN